MVQMPEIAEVRHVAEQLHQQLVGKILCIVSVTERLQNKSIIDDKFNPPYIIDSIKTRGKRILIHLVDKKKQPTYTLVSWLGMTGRWDFQGDKHTQAVFACATPSATPGADFSVIDTFMYYNNSRFGMLDIIPHQKLHDWLISKVGDDLLDSPPTVEEWISKWRSWTARKFKQQVCQVLMDQSFYAGVGNYLKAEILYKSRLYPGLIARDLTDEQLTVLHSNLLQTVQQAYEHGGATLRDYITPDGKKGRYQQHLLVYQQKACPSGHTIQKDTFSDNRTTHWCPECQI